MVRPPAQARSTGRTVRDVLGEAAYAAVAPHVRAALAGRLVTFEAALTYRDGKPRHVRATYVPDVGDDGRVRGFVATSTTSPTSSGPRRSGGAPAPHRRAGAGRAHAHASRSTSRRWRSGSPRASCRCSGPAVLGGPAAAARRLARVRGHRGQVAGELQAGLPSFRPGWAWSGERSLERRALWTSNILDEPSVVLTPDFRRGLAGAGHHAVLAVPLQVKGEIIGAISTAHREIRDLLAGRDRSAPGLRRPGGARDAQRAALRARAGGARRGGGGQPGQGPVPRLARPRAAQSAGADPRPRPHSCGGPSGGAGHRARRATIVERQASHLARLLDDLLDVSRITRGKIELRRSTVALADGRRRRAGGRASARSTTRRHAVSVALPPTARLRRGRPRAARADRRQPAQQRREVHAARAAASASSVVAERRRGGARASATPASGSPPEMLPRIFELFAQGDQSLAHTSGWPGHRPHAGAAARRAARRPRGRPQRRAPAAAASSRSGCRSAGRRRRRRRRGTVPAPSRPACRCCVIEDNADARRALRAVLEHEGHRVDDDGRRAERAGARPRRRRPDVVLIDIGLPGLDGYEVARRIRAGAVPEPILVAITGYGQADDRRRSLEAGFDAHLTKPVAPRAPPRHSRPAHGADRRSLISCPSQEPHSAYP